MSQAIQMGFPRPTGEFIETKGNLAFERAGVQSEGAVREKLRMIAELETSEVHQDAFVSIEILPRAFVAHAQFFPHLIVKVFK